MPADFTNEEIQVLKLAFRVVHITEQEGELPRAQLVFVDHLRDALARLHVYKQVAKRDPDSPLADWPNECVLFCAVELPRSCHQRAAKMCLAQSLTLAEISAQMQRTRRVAAQIVAATMVSASHATNGCNAGRACKFCI